MERSTPITRIGAAVGIRPEAIETYRALHANPWPEVLGKNTKAGRTNYSIFLLPQKTYHSRTTNIADRIEPLMRLAWRKIQSCKSGGPAAVRVRFL
jgi:L-rhamnose mutarotase